MAFPPVIVPPQRPLSGLRTPRRHQGQGDPRVPPQRTLPDVVFLRRPGWYIVGATAACRRLRGQTAAGASFLMSQSSSAKRWGQRGRLFLDPLALLQRRLAVLLAIYLGSCIAVYGRFEGWVPSDCVYFAVTSMTTVGFGDMWPQHPASKLFSCLWILLAVVSLASRLSKALNSFVSHELAQANKTIRQHFLASLSDDEEEDFGEPARSLRVRRQIVVQALLLAGFILLSSIVARSVLQLSPVDALYFSITTLTTVGLGDIVPQTPAAKYAVAMLCLLGVPLFGSALANLVSLTLDRCPHVDRIKGGLTPQKLVHMQHFAQAMYERGVYPGMMNLSDAVAGERKIHPFEFCCFVLVQNHIINMEDMDLMLRNFKELDIQEDGYLQASDVKAWNELRRREANESPDQRPDCESR